MKLPKDYEEWMKRKGEDVPEPLAANPDGAVGPSHDPSAAEEAVRLILDDPKARFALLSPVEQAVFYAVHIDGLSERKAAAKLGRSRREIELAIAGIRRTLTRVAARIEAGLPPYTAAAEKLSGGQTPLQAPQRGEGDKHAEAA